MFPSILRDAADATRLQPRQGDDAVSDDDAVTDEEQLTRPRLRRVRGAVEDDAAPLEHGADGVARLASEGLERRCLRRDEVDLRGDRVPIEPGGGHQRELVRRQAPHCSGRDDERDLRADPAASSASNASIVGPSAVSRT